MNIKQMLTEIIQTDTLSKYGKYKLAEQVKHKIN